MFLRCCSVMFLALALDREARGQDEVGRPLNPEEEAAEPEQVASYENTVAGELTPGRGFTLMETPRGSINVSVYGLIRYLNQLDEDGTFVDHLGRDREVVARHDLNWHRTFVWISGFFWTKDLMYTVSVWSLPTTEQNLVFGLLRYHVGRGLTLGTGVGPSLTARSMQGSWPYWPSADRQMAEEFYRGGFASSFFVTGEPLRRVFYTAALNRSLSQLGIPALFDNRAFAVSGSVWVMPTTGEFGPRGGFGDLEHHREAATRFGVSGAHAREGRYAENDAPPRHGQLKLSDGVNPFETGALVPGVTVEELDYDEVAADAGLKYRGLSLQGEYALRWLSDFEADGRIRDDAIFDHGFYATAGYMVVPRYVGAYVTYGAIFDEFEREPWELSGGASFYPFAVRSLRLNVHYIHVERSPTGSAFGFYTAGQTGDTISVNTDFLL